MCLSVFAYKTVPDYPFIFAANRDEFYSRPAQPATFWYDYPNLLAGRDLKAGGTWMGITEDNRFASLTNYRDINNIKENAPSRGKIVEEFLTTDSDPLEFLKELKKEAHLYNGFNLIAGTTEKLWYFSNQIDVITEVKPGFHSLSNAFLNTSRPKTDKALSEFTSIINENESEKIDERAIFDLLKNDERYPDDQLLSTGLSIEMERIVSSIFISSENYGTRCSTLIYQDRSGLVTFDERTYDPIKGDVEVKARYKF